MQIDIDTIDLHVLKAITTNRKFATEFVNECDHKLFSAGAWRFADVVCNHIRVYKEVPTLRVLADRFEATNPKLIEYINEIWAMLDSTTFNENECRYNLKKLKDRFITREVGKLQASLGTQKDMLQHTLDIQRTLATVKGLSNFKSFESKTLKDALPSFIDQYNAKKKHPELEVGIKTGYSFFDQATNGVKPSDMIIIAGESGFGKSLLLMNMAIQIWLQQNTIADGAPFGKGKNIVYFSLEMPFDECLNRLIARLAMVPSRKIENAKLTSEEFAKVRKAIEFIKSYPYQFKIIDVADACANDIENAINDIDFQIDTVFIDYLGIMHPNEKNEDQDWLKQGIVAYETRAIGRRHNLPIFTAVQLNRKATAKDGETIGLARLARSATIATHATTVLQIESRPNEESFPDMVVHIIKNRKGIKGKGSLLKHLGCACLEDMPGPVSDPAMDVYFPNADDISEEVEELEL